MMHLETPRMMIRNFIPEDAADLHEIFGDAETMEYSEAPYDLDKTKQFLGSFCIAQGRAVAAVHKGSGKVIGYILFSEIQPGEYELGWFFNRHFWRQGYAYEACKAVMDHAFRTMEVENIYYDNIVHVSVYRGAAKVFSKDFRKDDFAETVPANMLKQCVLSDIKLIEPSDDGLHYRAQLAIPDSPSSFMAELIISYDGKTKVRVFEMLTYCSKFLWLPFEG